VWAYIFPIRSRSGFATSHNHCMRAYGKVGFLYFGGYCYKNLIHQCSIITVTFCIEEQELGVYIQETGEHSVPRGTVKK
jgi:hypothetical protein